MFEMKWLLIIIKIIVFFGMMWSLSFLVPKIASSIKEDKKNIFEAFSLHKRRVLLFGAFFFSVCILAFL